jgi:hypothetical protein
MRYRDFADKTFANRTFANTPPGISPIGESTIGESLIGEIPISHIYTSQRRCSNVISVSVYTDAEIVDAPGTLCQCRRWSVNWNCTFLNLVFLDRIHRLDWMISMYWKKWYDYQTQKWFRARYETYKGFRVRCEIQSSSFFQCDFLVKSYSLLVSCLWFIKITQQQVSFLRLAITKTFQRVRFLCNWISNFISFKALYFQYFL